MSTTTRLLQRQILPIDRDTDVFPLYVDLEEAKLDTDRHAVGGDKAADTLEDIDITATFASLDSPVAAEGNVARDIT